MRKISILFMALIATTALWAADFIVDGIAYNILGGDSVKVISKVPKYSGTISIPTSVTYSTTTYHVTSIGDSAFSGCKLDSVIVPNTIDKIGKDAFSGISGYTFPFSYSIVKLLSVTPPAILDVNYTGIDVIVCDEGIDNYLSNDSWKYIDIRSTYAGRFDTAFIWRKTKTDSTLTISGQGAMKDYYPPYWGGYGQQYWAPQWGSVNHVVVENGITRIGGGTFAQQSNLVDIQFANSVKEIGPNNFTYCNKLKQTIFTDSIFVFLPKNYEGTFVVPNGIKHILGGAFYNCSSLTHLEIPSSVQTAGDAECFSSNGNDDVLFGCNSLKYLSMDIPNVADNLLTNLNGLDTICWGANTKSLGGNLSGCNNITHIQCYATTPPTCADNIFNALGQFTTNVAVPSASVSMYQVALGWRYFYNLSPIVMGIKDNITNSPSNRFTKIIKDGQLLILRDNKTYNAQGIEVR